MIVGFCLLNSRESYNVSSVEDIASAIADSTYEDFSETQIVVDCSIETLSDELEEFWKSYYDEDDIEEQRELFGALLDDQSIRTGV